MVFPSLLDNIQLKITRQVCKYSGKCQNFAIWKLVIKYFVWRFTFWNFRFPTDVSYVSVSDFQISLLFFSLFTFKKYCCEVPQGRQACYFFWFAYATRLTWTLLPVYLARYVGCVFYVFNLKTPSCSYRNFIYETLDTWKGTVKNCNIKITAWETTKGCF